MKTKKGIEIIRHMVPTPTNVVELDEVRGGIVMPSEPDFFEFTLDDLFLSQVRT